MDGAKLKDEAKSKAKENAEEKEEEAAQEPTLMEESGPQAAAVGEGKETESEIKAKTGRAKRKEKRLRHEPQSVTIEEGPSGVHVLHFAEAHATELSSIVTSLRSKGGSKRTFQLLPRHMRRRAMSHNVKRLPRRLRSKAQSEMDRGKGGMGDAKRKAKKPSRKQKRKLSKMRLEYERRQRKHKWLETHVWHAKRMVMCKKYGFHVADHCCDKGVRQAYLSMTYGCLLSDISYYCCTEICGEQSTIVSSLSQLFSPETGLTIKAKAFLNGQREGQAVMYRPGAYPYGAIGPVQFLWRAPPPRVGASRQAPPIKGASTPAPPIKRASTPAPPTNPIIEATSSPQTTKSTLMSGTDAGPVAVQCGSTKLWIWCHPAIHDAVLSEIRKAVESLSDSTSRDQQGGQSSTAGMSITGPVTVEDLKLGLNRFRLIGPRSQALLMETLKPFLTFTEAIEEKDEALSTGLAQSATPVTSDPSPAKWWKGELQQHMLAHSNVLSRSLPSVKSLPSPAHIGKGSVIGVTVIDPRIFTPSKRTDKVSAYYPKKKNGYLLRNSFNDRRKGKERKRDWMSSDSDSSTASGHESGVDGDTSDMEVDHTEDFDSPVVTEEMSEDQSSLSSSGTQSSTLQWDFPSDIAFSPIWDQTVRDAVKKSKIPDRILNLQRSRQLVCTSKQDLQKMATKVPVLLIQQSLGSTHQGSGWDLIVPSNWGMAFWVSLNYRGARACGMRELQKCLLEVQTLHFPLDYLDTAAGQLSSDEQRQLLEAKHRRYPPDKRRNYGKLLIRQPFCCPWSDLVNLWRQESRVSCILSEPQVVNGNQPDELPSPTKRIKLSSRFEVGPEVMGCLLNIEAKESMGETLRRYLDNLASMTTHDAPCPQVSTEACYVLRSRDILRCLHHFIEFVFSKKHESDHVRGGGYAFTTADSNTLPMEASRFFLSSMQYYQIDEHLRSHSCALVAVKFETKQRGAITNRATISLPSSGDLQLLANGSGKSREYSGPKEELNQRGLTIIDGDKIFIGVSSLSRKKIKEVKCKRLQRKSEKPKNCNAGGSGQSSSVPPPISAWDEFKLQSVRPSRMEIGYATSAGYRMTTSHFCGVGFCTFAGLIEMIKRCFLAPGVNEPLALVRGESIQHWFIKLQLL